MIYMIITREREEIFGLLTETLYYLSLSLTIYCHVIKYLSPLTKLNILIKEKRKHKRQYPLFSGGAIVTLSLLSCES